MNTNIRATSITAFGVLSKFAAGTQHDAFLEQVFLPLYVQLLISICISLNDFFSYVLESPEICFCSGAYCTTTSDFASS